MGTAKTFSPAQRRQALQTAQRTRRHTKELTRELSSLSTGEAWRESARLLTTDPSSINHLEIHEFLRRIPGVGDVRVRKILQRDQIWPLKRVRDLTERERQVIANRITQNGGW